jgi:uncharacterized protein (DUF1697 family)
VPRYIALVRGINVGGHSPVKMADLRSIFVGCGLLDVSTYIQSGNVLFSTVRRDLDCLTAELEKALAASAGPKAAVFLLSPADLQEAVAHNPFKPKARDAEQRCQLMFLSAEPAPERRRALMALEGKEYHFHIFRTVLYLAYPRTYDGRRRMLDFEKVLGVAGTARSWNVVDKLIELSRGCSNEVTSTVERE